VKLQDQAQLWRIGHRPDQQDPNLSKTITCSLQETVPVRPCLHVSASKILNDYFIKFGVKRLHEKCWTNVILVSLDPVLGLNSEAQKKVP
jgi:hypothetical protein